VDDIRRAPVCLGDAALNSRGIRNKVIDARR
jgi:hypothetical protein